MSVAEDVAQIVEALEELSTATHFAITTLADRVTALETPPNDVAGRLLREAGMRIRRDHGKGILTYVLVDADGTDLASVAKSEPQLDADGRPVAIPGGWI
jgi:hypothetical protein